MKRKEEDLIPRLPNYQLFSAVTEQEGGNHPYHTFFLKIYMYSVGSPICSHIERRVSKPSPKGELTGPDKIRSGLKPALSNSLSQRLFENL